jgi:hypothetical protein
MSPDYYENKVYPLQDRVLRLVEKVETTFYLTNGTALSRAWLKHRYSHDLYFFSNNDAGFNLETEKFYSVLFDSFGDNFQRQSDFSDFHRWIITEDGIQLKIELIKDLGFRKGVPKPSSIFHKTDSVQNIASNKICALSRNDPQDMADILCIEKDFSVTWPELLMEAKLKDLSVNEVEIANKIGEFRTDLLSVVPWITPPDLTIFRELQRTTAKKIIKG